jgi:hypothetical protein
MVGVVNLKVGFSETSSDDALELKPDFCFFLPDFIDYQFKLAHIIFVNDLHYFLLLFAIVISLVLLLLVGYQNVFFG